MIETILRFLPAGLCRKIEHRHGLMRIINNISWLFFDKFLRMGVGLVVDVWIVRYLGPDQFGLFSYSIAFVALFTIISSLGLYQIVVRDLVQDPTATGTTMGTAFTLQVLSGLCAFGLALMAIIYIRPNDAMAQLIVLLLALPMVVRSIDVVRYWFESQVQAKYVVWTENLIFIVFAAVKIWLILAKAPLIAFVWAIFAEGLLVSAGLMILYALRGGQIRVWMFRIGRAKILLKDSWPQMFSSIAIMVYMRIDQIMLGQMLGDKSVGIYSAVVGISEVWYFIPVAITASVLPSLIESKKKNETLYYGRLQKLLNWVVILALAVAIPMTFLSTWIVTLLYGPAYQQAGPVLAVHIWAGIFVFLGVASGPWFLIEGLLRFNFYRAVLGMVVNVGLNFVLIPKFGVIGAAWATVMSQACASMFFNALYSKTRQVFLMQCKSFLIIGNFFKKT